MLELIGLATAAAHADPPLDQKVGALPAAESRLHERVRQGHDRVGVRSAKFSHPHDLVAKVADADSAADGTGRISEFAHRRGIEQIEQILALPGTVQLTIRSLDPLFLWHGFIE